jgi:hypothetical protein
MKAIWEFFAMLTFGRVYGLVAAVVKSYFLRLYIGTIEIMRDMYFAFIFTITCLLLILSGFILLHVALFLSLPWELKNKIILMFVLGFLYLIIPLLIMAKLVSKETWFKITGAKKLFDDIEKD